ncbi:MAG: TetR/AcrR family transcriptional regulator [Thermodesulfobacteriota bacterium]
MMKKRLTANKRKAQIVRIATALFVKKGFKGTTTREIARKAGISEAVIYKYFAKKEDLYRAIISAECDDDLGKSRLYGALEGKEGRELFYELAFFLITENTRDQTLMRLLTQSALERRELSEVFIKIKGLELIEFLEKNIKELIKEGVFKEVDAGLAARAFLGMVLHYVMSQEIYGLKKYCKRSTSEAALTFVDIFFDGISRRRK